MKCKNVLVVYRGGSYDGCIWEWNLFSFDSAGTFFNLFSSGSNGIKTFEQAIAIMDSAPKERGGRDDVYIYDLEKESDIDEFQKEHAIPLVVGAVKMLNDGEHGVYSNDIWFRCDECDEKINTEGQLENWHGCGGIMSTADTKLCDDCHSKFTCYECGEYDKSCENNGGVCDSCNESAIEAMLDELDDDCVVLEYNRLSNTFTEIQPSESNIPADYTKDNDGYFIVKLKTPDGTKKFIIEGVNTTTALDDVRSYYEKPYYTATAETLTDFIRNR